MRLSQWLCVCLIFSSAAMKGESKNPANYPLRVHVFGFHQAVFYRNRDMEESKGEGRANLFENSDVQGIDFSFDCSEKLTSSFGYETYPAKWKKQNQELTVLLPEFGRANHYFTCNLKTQMKDYVYARTHNGGLVSEPATAYKAWMVQHDYNPEKGKNMPIRPELTAGEPAQSGNPQQ